MANLTATTTFVAREMGEFWLNLNPLFMIANRNYVGQFQVKGYAPGNHINVKIPGSPSVERGLAVSAQPIQDVVIPLTITEDDIYNVTYSLDLYDERFNFVDPIKALTVPEKEALVDNYAMPAYQSLSVEQEVEAAFRLKTSGMYTPIDEISKLGGLNNFSSVSAVNVFMDYMQYQTNERYFVTNLTDSNSVSNSLQNSFVNAYNKKITESAFVGGSAQKGNLAGMDMFKSQNFYPHEAGALAGETGITVSAIDSTGTEVTLTGVPSTTAQLVNAGDKFSITSVNILTPIGHKVTPFKLVLTALDDADGDGAGNVVITLPYPLMASGMHSNVSALPAPGAAVVVYPSTNVNYAMVPSGLSIVPLPLGDIAGASNSSQTSLNKCPVKAYIQGSVNTGVNIFRIAQLVGIRAFTPYVVPVPTSLT